MTIGKSADLAGYDSSIITATKVALIVKDEPIRQELKTFLSDLGYAVHSSLSVGGAMEILSREGVDIAVVDFDFAQEEIARIVSEGKKSSGHIEFIGLFEKGNCDAHFSGFNYGFIGFMLKPLENLSSYDLMFYHFAKKVQTRHSGVRGDSKELASKNKDLDAKINEIERAMAIAATLASPHKSLDEKLEIALRMVLEQFDASRGSVLLIDHRKNEMEIRAATDQKLIGLRQPLEGESPSAWVARHAQPLNVDEAGGEGQYKARGTPNYSRDSFLSYPIKGGNKVLGVFNVTNKRKGAFTKADEQALYRFMDRVAVTLENATLNEKLKLEHEKLNSAMEKLKKLEDLKDNLTHMIVHDLKGPIGEIKANLSMLSSVKLQDFEEEVLLTANLGAEQLLAMVMDILDVNKMEEGKFQIFREKIDLQELVGDKAAQLEALLRLDNKHLETHLSCDDYLINADGGIVTRVLQNFLTNALNYTPEDGTIAIIVENAGPDKVRIAVQDSGPGVPENYRKKIFEKFGTVSGDDRKSKLSTGLGLTFCKMAIDAHGGEIGVEKAPEGGSIFYFTLPRK